MQVCYGFYPAGDLSRGLLCSLSTQKAIDGHAVDEYTCEQICEYRQRARADLNAADVQALPHLRLGAGQELQLEYCNRHHEHSEVS